MRTEYLHITAQEITDEAVRFLDRDSYYQATAYDTTLLISEVETYDPFHHFELFDRKILWINQVTQEVSGSAVPRMARTIFICDKDNFDGHIVAHRFASILCYATHSTIISPRIWAGTAFPVPSAVQPSEKYTGILYTHDQIDNAIVRLQISNFTEKKYIALAHYRQAALAQTPYYEVLSYWKIIELHFNNVNKKMNKYINDLYSSRPDIFSGIPAFSGNASSKLWQTRHSSAHFAQTGGHIQDPDNPDLFNIANQSILPLRRLAEGLIEKTIGW
jgi:hypothetical protein